MKNKKFLNALDDWGSILANTFNDNAIRDTLEVYYSEFLTVTVNVIDESRPAKGFIIDENDNKIDLNFETYKSFIESFYSEDISVLRIYLDNAYLYFTEFEFPYIDKIVIMDDSKPSIGLDDVSIYEDKINDGTIILNEPDEMSFPKHVDE